MMLSALYFVLAAATTLVLAELGARLWITRFGSYFVHRPHLRHEFYVDSEVLPDLPKRVRFSANADGERGDRAPRDPDAVHRVLVAGGSAAECYMLDQDDAWSTVLQRELNARGAIGRPAHVGNIARSLMPSRTIDALLKRALPRFRSLDTIVLMVGASDLLTWFEAGAPDTIDESIMPITRYCDEHPEGPFTWSVKGTALYRVVRRTRARFPDDTEPRRNVGRSIAKHRKMRADATTLVDEVPDPSPMLQSFERHLTSLIHTCRQRATRVIVARQPWMDKEFTEDEAKRLWNFGQGSPYLGPVDSYYTHRVVRDVLTQVDDVAKRTAEATGVRAIDLRDVVPSDFEHYYDMMHFTPEGAKKVGEALAECIEEGLRPARPSLPSELRAVPDRDVA